jgi:ABC-2 type transport system ATP-binding protein
MASGTSLVYKLHMTEIIITEKLSKHYKDVDAVSEVSLSVRKGEIYGFLGLNGAGKTTTIRMLLGMVKPTSGKIFINGEMVFPENHELWKRIGYLVEVPYSYPNLTVRENLEIIRRLRFLSDKSSVDVVIEKLKLNAYANKKAKHLSLGNSQRLGLAKALIHDPEILILDEPANGLDPEGIHEIRVLLSDLAANLGTTVFISSHILSEISKLSTRIGIIHGGRLIKELNNDELTNLSTKSLFITGIDNSLLKSTLITNGYNIQVTGTGLLQCMDNFAVNHPETIATLLVNAGCPPTLLKVEEEDLESFFLRTIDTKTNEK